MELTKDSSERLLDMLRLEVSKSKCTTDTTNEADSI